MNKMLKLLFATSFFCIFVAAKAQTADATIENPSVLAEEKVTPALNRKEMAITIKNNCENHVSVFAGSKKAVFDGKSQTLGGISTNMFYLQEGDVVCIMNGPKAIQACSIAKEGLSKIEINKSGNGFLK